MRRQDLNRKRDIFYACLIICMSASWALVICLSLVFPCVSFAQTRPTRSGTRDGGGGGHPYIAEVITNLKNTVAWLDTLKNPEQISPTWIVLYRNAVASLESRTQKGHKNGIIFSNRMPRDREGRARPILLDSEPGRDPVITIYERAWETLESRPENYFGVIPLEPKDILFNYDFEYEFELVMMRLAKIPLVNQEQFAKIISNREEMLYAWARVKPSISSEMGPVIYFSKNHFTKALKYISIGTPGYKPSLWPPRTLVSAPISNIYLAFEELKNAEQEVRKRDLGTQQIEPYVSLASMSSNEFTITLSKDFPGSKDEAVKSFLATFQSENIRFRVSQVEDELCQVELLPDSQLFGSMEAFQNYWLRSGREESAYSFSAEVKDSSSIYFSLRLLDFQDPSAENAFNIRFSKLHDDEPARFEISFAKKSSSSAGIRKKGFYRSKTIERISYDQ